MESITNSRINCRFTETGAPSNDVPFVDDYLKEPLVSLENALRELSSHVKRLNVYREYAQTNCNKSTEYRLTLDESAAIYLYTMQWKEGSSESLYYILNESLRSGNNSTMKRWFPYLKLLVTALKKIPSLKTEVWRNLAGDFNKDYPQNKSFQWAHVTSCSRDVEQVIKCFWNLNGQNTLFKINTVNGKNISAYSQFPNELEVVLLPGTRFRVTEKFILDKVSNCTNVPVTYLQEL